LVSEVQGGGGVVRRVPVGHTYGMPHAPAVNDVLQRWEELRDPDVRAALKAECRAAVVEEEWRAEGSQDHLPAPYWTQQLGRVPARTLDGPPGVWIGRDAEGRAVVADEHGRTTALLRWSAEGVEVFMPDRSLLEVYALRDGRPAGMVSVRPGEGRGAGPYTETNYYTYDDMGRPQQALHLYRVRDAAAGWQATTSWFTHDAEGRLARVDDLDSPPPLAPGGDEAAALAAALALSPADYASHSVIWDARRLAREDDLPDPAAALDDLAVPLARAIRAAAQDAVADLAFVVVDVIPYAMREDAPLVRVAAVSAAGRERIVRAGAGSVAEVIHLAFAETEGTGPVDVLAVADPDLARRLRAASQALAGDAEVRAERVAAFAPELAAALGAIAVVRAEPGGPPLPSPLLASLEPVVPSAGAAGLPDAVAALLAAAGAERLEDAMTEPYHYAPCALRVPDRDVLALLLGAAGLADADAATIAADARWALVLEADPRGASRIGGHPVLPADVPWPTAHGRALSHLATLALAELPAVEGRDVLPADGHLAFFADLTEAAEVFDPIEPGGRRELIRIVHAPAGAATHEPDPPADAAPRDRRDPPALLRERRVAAVPRLQLRHVGFGFGATLWGIDELAERTVGRLTPAVNGDPGHQLLGWPSTVQDDPRNGYRDDAEALLHLVPDREIGFMMMDGGDMMFFASRDALRATDWDQVTAWPSTG
jgi:Domain of unknown function (DUF1963)